MIRNFTFIFFIILNHGFARAFSEKRQFQLDSAVSVMNKKLVKDFHKSHHYLDSVGKTDDEKAWLFYAYIACHFKYDYDRIKKSSKISREYTVEYTSFKTSGVCRDFAKLFTGLCVKSNIPCLSVIGKSKISILNLKLKLKYLLQFSNHQWNVVRLNNEWFLVDPTWSRVEKMDKITYLDSKKQKHYVKIKRPSKVYFCSSPSFFIKTHLPMHPAFYCSNQVPKFRTRHKKNWQKKLLYTNYDYNSFLNQMWNLKYPYLSTKFIKESEIYANKAKRSSQLNGFLSNEVSELLGPKAPIYPMKLVNYKEAQAKWREMEKICEDSLRTKLFITIQANHEKEILKLKRKLEKIDTMEKMAAEKKKKIKQ